MKAFLSVLLAFLVAFGAPGALAQQAPENGEAVVQPQADDDAQPPQESGTQRPEQAIYKGVVGNLLEAVPMDAAQRVDLQRANAVVSAPFTVRSIALLVGITNPVVMIGGLIWGFWAASQIEDARPADKAATIEARADVTAEVTGD
jgi:hypothetical protein